MGVGPTQPTEEYFNRGQWGHDGTQWRKLALTWGFTERLVGQVIDTNASAGTNNLTTPTIPDDEVWVFNYLNMLNVNTAPSLVYMMLWGGGVKVVCVQSSTLLAGQYLTGKPGCVLVAGDKIEFQFYGCNAGDDLHCRWWGYKMKVK